MIPRIDIRDCRIHVLRLSTRPTHATHLDRDDGQDRPEDLLLDEPALLTRPILVQLDDGDPHTTTLLVQSAIVDDFALGIGLFEHLHLAIHVAVEEQGRGRRGSPVRVWRGMRREEGVEAERDAISKDGEVVEGY